MEGLLRGGWERSALALAAAFLASLLTVLPSAGAGMTFGAEESLHRLVDVEVVGENNEPLSLGYKTTTQNFLLPYTLSDDGYVLMPRDNSGNYYNMTEEDIARWQANGSLPDPLPAYDISLLDRVLGYLLWPTLVVIALLYLVPWLRKRRARSVAADAPPPSASA